MLCRNFVVLSLCVFCGCGKKGSDSGGIPPTQPVDTGWPYPPYNVKAEASADGAKIAISWTDQAKNETGFYLMRFDHDDRLSNKYERLFTLPADATSFDDVAARPCTRYHYEVQAYNRYGKSQPSPSNTVTLPVYPPECTATYVSPSEGIRVVIKHTFICVKGYTLYRSVNRGNWEHSENFAPYWGAIVHYDTDIQDGVEYCYQVLMYSEAGESPPVRSNCVIPHAAIPPPDPPQRVDIAQDDGGNLVVDWDDAGNAENGFFVYRQVDTSTLELWADVPANRTSYTDDQVMPCHAYAYAVSAYGGGGESTKKDSTAFTVPPPPPTTVQATFSGFSRGITVDFNDTSTCERWYRLYRSANDGDFSLLAQLPATDDVHVQHFDRSVQPGTTYCYAVSVVLSTGQESPRQTTSNCVVAAGLVPDAPAGSDATFLPLERSVQLIWDDRSTDEDGFIIERTHIDGKITRTDHFELAANVANYNDRSVQSGFDYCYRVAAFNQAGRSVFSSRDCVAVDFVNILTPRDGLVTNTNCLSFTAQVLPNISRLSDTTPALLFVNNRSHDVGFWNNYIFSNVLLTPGKNEIVLSLGYKNGEVVEVSATVTYDAAYTTPDQPILYSALNNAIALTDPVTMQNIAYLCLPFSTYYDLRIAPDGEMLYAFRKGFVTRVDATYLQVLDEKQVREDDPLAFDQNCAVALSNDGEYLALGLGREFKVYHTQTWKVVQRATTTWRWPTKITHCAFNPVTSDLYIGAVGVSGNHLVLVGMFKAPEYEENAYTYQTSWCCLKALAASPDGTTVVVASADSGRGLLSVFDAAEGKGLYKKATIADFALGIWFEPDSRTYWANDSSYYYRVETATGTMTPSPGQVRSFSGGILAAEPNVGFIPVADASGFNRIVKFNLETNETTATGFIAGVPNVPIGFNNLVYQP